MVMKARVSCTLLISLLAFGPLSHAQEANSKTSVVTWTSPVAIDLVFTAHWERDSESSPWESVAFELHLSPESRVSLRPVTALRLLEDIDFFRHGDLDDSIGPPVKLTLPYNFGENHVLDRLVDCARVDFQLALAEPEIHFVFEDSVGNFAVVYQIAHGPLYGLGNRSFLFGEINVCEIPEEDVIYHLFPTKILEDLPHARSTVSLGWEGAALRTTSVAGKDREVRLSQFDGELWSTHSWSVRSDAVQFPDAWSKRTASARLQSDTLLGSCALSMRAQLKRGLNFDVSLLLDVWQGL